MGSPDVGRGLANKSPCVGRGHRRLYSDEGSEGLAAMSRANPWRVLGAAENRRGVRLPEAILKPSRHCTALSAVAGPIAIPASQAKASQKRAMHPLRAAQRNYHTKPETVCGGEQIPCIDCGQHSRI
jgi:hypothetical protein